MPLIVRVGDRDTHGGRVREGGSAEAEGRAIAREGDRVDCPEHGRQRITGGSSTVECDGKAVAYDGLRTTCGARLIASAEKTLVGE